MLDDFVDEAIGQGFVRSHVEVSVRVQAKLLDRLCAEFGHVSVQDFLGMQDKLRSNLQISCLCKKYIKSKI